MNKSDKVASKKLNICFVSQNIFPVLNPVEGHNFMGGAEFQQLLLAKELLGRGHKVTFITHDFGQGAEITTDKVRVLATSKPNDGIRVIRFIYPLVWKLWRALQRSDSEIYYVRCAGYSLAVVICWAKLNRKKVVYCGANDPDFDPIRLKLPTKRDKILFFWGLNRCDSIVVQNTTQSQLLKTHFKKSGTLIGNGMPSYRGGTSKNLNILWVASIKKQKRPESFLNLAKQFPNESFVMIGGRSPRQQKIYDRIEAEARTIKNLRFLGFQPFNEVEKAFGRTKVFVNTSEHEGFPNTFLQAWRRGIPVISFVMPNEELIKSDLFIKVATEQELFKAVDDILSGAKIISATEIREYFNNHFTIGKQVDKYEILFRSLCCVES